MICAIHTIIIPGKTLFPGDTAKLPANREQRLIEDGFAEPLDTAPAPVASSNPDAPPETSFEPNRPASEPEPEPDPEREQTDDSDSPRPAAIKKIGRKPRK